MKIKMTLSNDEINMFKSILGHSRVQVLSNTGYSTYEYSNLINKLIDVLEGKESV